MELEAAQWFSRDEVQRAYDRTCSDPKFKVSDYLFNVTIFFKNAPKGYDDRQKLLYVPPRGAVAFRLIGEWLAGKL